MYQNIFVDRRNEVVHLWDDEKGHVEFPVDAIRYAYRKKQGGEFKSLYGDELEEIMYYQDNDPTLFESDVSVEVKTLTKVYEDSDDPSEGHRVGVIDIEVDSTGGFPIVDKGDKAITCIALYDAVTETFTSFVLDPERKVTSRIERTKFKDTDTKDYQWEIKSFRKEDALLESFLDKWEECNFSIITGWNSNGFDLPYIYSRIREVLGKKAGYKLSSVKICYLHRFTKQMRIAGMSCLDYNPLYKKFIGKDQPSFTLGYIGQEEVGIGKVQFRGSLVTLYKQDLDKYVEYNLVDVKIVAALDKKLDFIHLARSVCHKGHVPYEWYMYSSRWIDGALLTYLHRNKLIAPNKPEGGKEAYEAMKEEGKEGFEGAYVKDPIPGLYDWVYSSDVTSLYPSAIMSINISPETKMGKVDKWDTEKFANGEIGAVTIDGVPFTAEDFKDLIKDGKVGISSNGVLYKQPQKKIIGKIKGWNEHSI
jgi:DNA polymerase elongation subunit (family B)